jgi:RNA polymerase sigma-70 factor, ECF subfamily
VATPVVALDPESWRLLPDEQIIAAYRAGMHPLSRAGVADELFRRHEHQVLRWCKRFTRDPEVAADVAQESFLRAYRSLDLYRGECSFSTWLYAIARNQCYSELQRRAAVPSSEELVKHFRALDNSQDELELEQDRAESWRFLLRTLNPIEARVLLLHYGDDLPLRQVNSRLGLTNKSGAKAYIVSARRKIESALRQRENVHRRMIQRTL